jgi:hypothetical protein
MLLLLEASNLRFRNKAQTLTKLLAIKADGISHLHFISDFDMTLTRYIVSYFPTDS